MALRLYNKEGTELFMESKFPCIVDNIINEPIHENIICINSHLGKGYYKEIYFDGIHMDFWVLSLAKDTSFYFESDYENVEMLFSLKGENTIFSNNFVSNISFESNHHNIIYANEVNGRIKWESKDLQLFRINFNPNIFKRFLPNEKLFYNFRNCIEKGKSGTFSSNNYCINIQMYTIIEEIIECKKIGLYKKMFLESKIIELLLLQLEQFTDQGNYSFSLKKRDIDKIYAVREIIMKNLNKNISLIELAHLVGTNEFMLKKGFKELFGTTVFKFWNDAKMEQAISMLIQENMNIKEISYFMGYKNQRHFTSAFKRKFGFPPSHLNNIYRNI